VARRAAPLPRHALRTLQSRRDLHADLLARLLEIGEPSRFLLEVARGARLLTHAASG
jgi:hypothetical protein